MIVVSVTLVFTASIQCLDKFQKNSFSNDFHKHEESTEVCLNYKPREINGTLRVYGFMTHLFHGVQLYSEYKLKTTLYKSYYYTRLYNIQKHIEIQCIHLIQLAWQLDTIVNHTCSYIYSV